jgi:hypothetical protein
MTYCNDNHPPRAEASRLLPVIGQVRANGRIVLRASEPPRPDPSRGVTNFPNDPREA